jgi:hypothetical protein
MRPRLGLVAMLVVVAVFGILRLDREVAFYDEGIYIVNGKALASGAGFRNLSLPDAPPQGKYPPFLPWLLSLVWRAWPDFPDNILAMKALVLLMGLALLVVTAGYLRTVLGFSRLDCAFVAALLGLSPYFLSYATLATSDISYALLSVSTLWLYERSKSRGRPAAFGLVLALAALAFLTRTAGALLLAALVGHLLFRRRFLCAALGAAVSAAVVVPWLLWSRWANAAYGNYPADVRGNYAGYVASMTSADWFREFLTVLKVNLQLLVHTWALFVMPWAPVILAPLILLVVYLFFRHRGIRMGAAELYCGLYLVSILIVPYPDTARYFLAIGPFLIAYFVGGLRRLESRPAETRGASLRARVPLRWALPVLVGAALATDLAAAWPPVQPAAQERYAQLHRMLDWITEHVPEDAVLVGVYDPAYYLFTGRRAVRLSVQDNFKVYYTDTVVREFPQAGELLAGFQRMRACYLIRDPMIGGREHLYFGNLIEAIRNASASPFELVYSGGNGSFLVYKRANCP